MQTDLCSLSHHLRHLGAQLVPSGAVGAEAGRWEVRLGLGGGLKQLVELQDLLLDAVEATQSLPALRLPLPLEFCLPKTLLLCLPQPEVDELTDKQKAWTAQERDNFFYPTEHKKCPCMCRRSLLQQTTKNKEHLLLLLQSSAHPASHNLFHTLKHAQFL